MFDYEDGSLEDELLEEMMREVWGRQDFDFGTC